MQINLMRAITNIYGNTTLASLLRDIFSAAGGGGACDNSSELTRVFCLTSPTQLETRLLTRTKESLGKETQVNFILKSAHSSGIPIVYILATVPSYLVWDNSLKFLSWCHILGAVSPWVGSFVYHLFMNLERGKTFYYRLLQLDMFGIWMSQSVGEYRSRL